ncbi:Chemotaxis regulator - transmits chemoreceptor signals to flagellar motor components CheY [hydrothermal vent metagenome]|uniref:Chemotaxis regulator - transmits chemoreceptor signals to flagellar motor components CheY n=1 Tax=hydrothermal vent metagenome TaxID=652676 RepID=A0A3B0ZIG2_9ZZZZ
MRTLTIEKLNILLVEPSSTQQRIISEHLNELGVTSIDIKSTGEEALTLMKQYHPDVVISAMHLPDMTGTDLLHNIRTIESLIDIPFVLISSETNVRYLEPLRQAGVIAILPKPYELKQLHHALISILDFIEPEPDHELEDASLDTLRILVVDDSVTSRRFIRRILTNLGIVNIQEAENGKEGLSLIESEYFDFILTDYNMPEMDGHDFTAHVRQSSNQPSIPIVMITSESNKSRLAAIEQLGVSAICDKPFEADTIKILLKSMLLDEL